MTEGEKRYEGSKVFSFRSIRYRVDFIEGGIKVLNLENGDDFFRTEGGSWTINSPCIPFTEDVFVPREYLGDLNQIVETAKKVKAPKALPFSSQK